MKRLTNILYLPLCCAALFLGSCGETEIMPPEKEGGDGMSSGSRELVLTLQNKVSLSGTLPLTRAEIATNDERRIDALDIYVFGSKELEGEYTFQEKFSYRSDGSTVENSSGIEVENGDGNSSQPTVLFRPKKGLYIKLYCVANQPDLYRLDTSHPDAPSYVKYEDYTLLQQTAPGSPDNVVTLGIPTESDFCGFISRPLNPANAADSIVPALVMVGAHIAPVDLHDFSLSSRLYAGVKLTRGVARFDVVNDASASRFTLESVSLGNGRSATRLFPLEALAGASGELVTYPFRSLKKMPKVNENQALPVFYSYACTVEDKGYLILKGKYVMNQGEVKDVSYNIDFSRVEDGNGSHIEISPNHRYTVAITKADPYRIDFNITVADWEEGGNLGDYTPENGIGELTVVPADQYDPDTRTMTTPVVPGNQFTLTTFANAPLQAQVLYAFPGNEWLDAQVEMNALTRTLWSQTGVCTVTVKEGVFTAYPDAVVRLINTANGSTNEIRVEAQGVYLGTVRPGDDIHNSYDETTQTLTLYGTDKAIATATVYCPSGLAALNLPDWITEEHKVEGGATDYTFTLNQSKFPSDLGMDKDATYTINFTDVLNGSSQKQLHLVLKSSFIDKVKTSLTYVSGNTGNTYDSTAGKETIMMKATAESTTSFKLKVPSPRGVTLSQTNYGWFTVSHTNIWKESDKYDEFTFTSTTGQSDYPDKSVVFTNNIVGGGNFTLTVTTGVFLGTVTGTGTAGPYNNYKSASNTLILYATNGNAATLKVYSPSTLTVTENLSWLTVTPSGSNTYIFALTGTSSSSTGSGTVTFTNSSNTSQSLSLNVSLQSSVIKTASLSKQPSGTSYSGTTLILNASNKTAFTLTIPSGRGTYLSGSTDQTWFTVTKASSWSESSPQDTYTIQVKEGDQSMTNKSIAFTNNISGAGNLTVTVKKNTSDAYNPIWSGNGVYYVNNSSYLTSPYSNENNTVTWSTASTACPNGQGWYMISRSDIESWGSIPSYTPGTINIFNFFLAFTNGYYWTNTVNSAAEGKMWVLDSKGGNATSGTGQFYPLYQTSSYRVRCIKK